MPTGFFLNLPVADLSRATAFYEALGATRTAVSDDTAAGMAFGEALHVMLLTHARFDGFVDRPRADARVVCEALFALQLESREAVDAMVQAAVQAGGRADPGPLQDHGFMYGRSVEDPDGHVWEPFWMDPAACPQP